MEAQPSCPRSLGSGLGSLRPGPPLGRGSTRSARPSRRDLAIGRQAGLTVSVFRLGKTAVVAPSPKEGRRLPPHSADARQRLVYCSLNDVRPGRSPWSMPGLATGLRRTSTRRSRQSVRLPDPCRRRGGLVGRGGVEPPTSRLSGVRSNHLSYRPNPVRRAGAPDPARSWWSLSGSNR
jgi:hypothetical protein